VSYSKVPGACGSIVVEALCYKPEGRGIVSRRVGFLKFT
jgi:hypothetical protein